MMKIYAAANITEAHIVKGMLESYGIPAYVQGAYLQGGIGELPAFDFANVYILNEQDTAQAQQILDEYDAQPTELPDDFPVGCPVLT